ncbi:diguanylate cyclase (GGDEF)-like protein [Celeribacter halophilus]|uniref:Diguanylate cyclase (GGDEF) domain-containing protein n=1 Tax=Celeribacter halophilus TaxID=576117 RepID=A0A1I3REA9_9RHOB|nr:diguanylate cyclase (GGDEF)-like protein [Celeribacter halophilus]SFJ44964.1 diguanylate cyclase (GGDEF) domain-containing protein [Celeribacter halophilus]
MVTPVTCDVNPLLAFMPLSLTFCDAGVILSVGPTLAKLRPAEELIGRQVTEVFALRDHGRGRGAGPVPLDTKLSLTFRSGRPTPLKGMAAALPNVGANFLNLSFGISIVDAVADYRLSAGDFAHTDLAIEMLYLVEAKSAVMEETKELNARLQHAKAAAEEQAVTDMLTGLRNRRALDQHLERLLRSNTSFALMHLDLDYFKTVNDTLGHAAGDAVLQKVAGILREETGEDDLAARLGGDEFILVYKTCSHDTDLVAKAQRLISRLEEPIPYQGKPCSISASIGITTTGFYDTPSAKQMIHDADLALYQSKDGGRGHATMFDPVAYSKARSPLRSEAAGRAISHGG